MILGFAFVFDFFWQYAVRLIVIGGTRLTGRLETLKNLYRRLRIRRLQMKAERLEKKYSRLPEDSRRIERILRRLAAIRQKLRLRIASADIVPTPYEPFVSIVIPCHNSEDVLGPTLDSVLSLNYRNKEVLVVDDGSSDGTKAVAEGYGDRIRLIVREASSGKKTGAIMFGLSFARGDVVVVIDDDTFVAGDSLGELLVPLVGDDVAAVGGNVRVRPGKQLLVKLQQIEYLAMMEIAKPFQTDLYRAVLIISGAFGAFKKELLDMVGAWDTDIITEDLDLTWKLYRLKQRVLFSGKAVCYTDVPTTLDTLVKQRMRWDIGLFQTLVKHRSFIFSRRFPALGFGLLPETIFFEVISVVARPLYLLIPLYLTGNVAGLGLLLTYFYLTLEFLVIFSAGLLSDDKRMCLKAVYAPLLLIYHQLLAVIRMAALLKFLRRRDVVW